MTEPIKVNTGTPRMFGETVNGGPVGDNRRREDDAYDQQFYLRPAAWTARLRAATNKALGRG